MAEEKFKRPLSMLIVPGTASERLPAAVEQLAGYGKKTKNINTWLTAGFMLGELGGAALQTWVLLDEMGELDGMGASEKAQELIKLLERIDRTTTKKPPVKVVENPPAIPPKKPNLKNLGTNYGS